MARTYKDLTDHAVDRVTGGREEGYAEVEAAARRANEGEIEDVAPRLVKVVEADGDAAVDIFLGGYVE